MNTSEAVITSIINKKPLTKSQFERARQEICSELRISQPPNRELLQAYQLLAKKKRIEKDKALEHLLKKATVRSQSGIAVITSLVKPYMCPGKCVYCPTEVRMPKSYVASEPAAARSLRLKFNPYDLMQGRIKMLEDNGHPVDKIEYIVKGGTWNAYPLRYQYWYMLESFRAANEAATYKHSNIKTLKHTRRTVESDWKDKSLEDLMEAIEIEQRKNERAKHRIIGVTLETRPDAISPKTIMNMRRQGCTRVELGLQAPDDEILTLIKRGHTVDQFRKAIWLLREAGFKVDLHFMPDLPGTTPEHDVEMYKLLFSDPALRPDMVKIYPNTVIPSAELYQWFLGGRYKPYGDEALFEALLQMKLATPRYCRISRLIRDIPATEIAAGNIVTNLREMLEARLKAQGKRCVCLRCREIGRHMETFKHKNIETLLFVETYETAGGTEYFLSFEDSKRIAVSAFLRLRIPHVIMSRSEESPVTTEHWTGGSSLRPRGLVQNDVLKDYLPEIRHCAFIRELHTYGNMIKIGKYSDTGSQHKGLGKALMKEAERIAREHGFKKIAVISGVGVRGYYRKLGYKKSGTYMIKKLDRSQ